MAGTVVPLPTEEDLRGRLLLPFLYNLNIAPDQLRLEHRFQLKLGHHWVTRAGDAPSETIAGRADILVTNPAGEPLFIVELKRQDASLTDEDRDQGISYARLLERMAPFVLVTNGRDSHLYDTVTRAELNDQEVAPRYGDWQNGRAMASTSDIALREDALQYFIGYSSANLREFANAQCAARMAPLKGEAGNRTKKYLPVVYEMRPDVRAALDRFLISPQSVFVLAGPSGCGKTNEMCALADRWKEIGPVLFFSGSHLAAPLANAIADEFAWHFSEELTFPKLCQRLSTLIRPTDPPLVLLIDAIDEVAQEGFTRAISELAARVSNTNGRIRLVVSLKSTEWRRFATFAGTPAALSTMCWRPNTGSDAEGQPTYTLGPLSGTGRDAAIAKYRLLFNLQGAAQLELLDALTDPFLLRIVAETYADGTELPREFGELEILRRYVHSKLATLDDELRRRDALRACEGVARVLYNHATPEPYIRSVFREIRGGGPVTILVNDAITDGGASDQGIRDAESHGLLLVSADRDGNRQVGFQYDRVKDYIVVSHVMRLPALSVGDLEASIERWIDTPLTRDALILYWRSPEPIHSAALAAFTMKRVERRVGAYAKGRATLGAVLQERIDPRTAEAIGGVYSLERDGSWTLSLVPRSAGDPFVHEVSNFADWWRQARAAPTQRQVRKVSSGYAFGLVLDNPESAGLDTLYYELREVARRGGLDQEASDLLAFETVTACVASNRKLFKFPVNTSSWSDREFLADLLPLRLETVKRRVQGYLGAQYYRSACINEQSRAIASSRKAAGLSGAFVVHSDQTALQAAEARGWSEAAAGKSFPVPRIHPTRGLSSLVSALDTLARRRGVIRYPYLPAIDGDPRMVGLPVQGPTAAAFKQFLAALFQNMVDEYEALAQTNLGSLARHLTLFRSLPVTPVVNVLPGRPGDRGELLPAVVQWGFVQTSQRSKAALISMPPDPNPFIVERGLPTLRARTPRGERPLVTGITVRNLESVLSATGQTPLEWDERNPSIDSRVRVRGLVYEQLLNDLAHTTDDATTVLADLAVLPDNRNTMSRLRARMTSILQRLVDRFAWDAN
jgi:hypothetical protein